MRRCSSLFIVALGAMSLTSCLASCHLSSAEADNCNSNPTIAREWPSPDGKRKVVESRFDCPGWYALKLEINNADGTKALMLDDRPVDQVRPAKWPDFKVDWKSPEEVWVTYPPRQDTTCISSAGGVQVHCLDAAVAR
jgi:hypothetical protein